MPKEISSEMRYGVWAGNPNGFAERKADCKAEVNDGYHTAQCQRPRGHGPEGEYCRQHAKKIASRERGRTYY